MKRRDHVNVFARLTQHLARDPGARSVRDRVVTVQQLEPVALDDFVHAHRESEIVRRKLEERITADIYFVEKNARQERWKPEWLAIRDEVDFVSALRQRDAELGRYCAGPSVRLVTGDAYVHSALSHHSRTTARASESSGLTTVTAAGGS